MSPVFILLKSTPSRKFVMLIGLPVQTTRENDIAPVFPSCTTVNRGPEGTTLPPFPAETLVQIQASFGPAAKVNVVTFPVSWPLSHPPWKRSRSRSSRRKTTPSMPSYASRAAAKASHQSNARRLAGVVLVLVHPPTEAAWTANVWTDGAKALQRTIECAWFCPSLLCLLLAPPVPAAPATTAIDAAWTEGCWTWDCGHW
ncbi:hypothetical protein EDC01DRAFT_746777 [Geopyxis carbonaria]|nr:hypothetical protein EDC01DRAFT_746777 [Geopyxis carbonaria]